MHRMKYINVMGGVWRLSNRAYRRLLRDAAAGEEWDADDYGKRICPYAEQFTDLTPEQAKAMLRGEDVKLGRDREEDE